MYRVPPSGLTELASQALEIPQIKFHIAGEGEVEPLKNVLVPLEIEGLCSGSARSNYKRNRIVEVCEYLDLEPIMPLWHKDPVEMLHQMVDSGFRIMIVRVSVAGLNDWLGKVLDQENVDEFLQACEEFRIDPAGEAREYETLVLSGPNMKGRIEMDYEKRWHGDFGELEISGSGLAEMRKQV